MKRFLSVILSAAVLFAAAACTETDPHELCETYADQVSWIPGTPQADLSASMTAEDLAGRNPNVCRFSVQAVDIMEMADTVDGGPAVKIFFTVEETAGAGRPGQTFFTFSSLPKQGKPEVLVGAKYVSVLNLNQETKEPFFFNPYWTFLLTEDGKLVNAFGCKYEEEHFEEFEQYNLSIPARLFTGRTEKELVDALTAKPEG